MRKQMVVSFVLGIAFGLSCWWLYSSASAAQPPPAAEVRFVPFGDARGVPVGHLVANLGGNWIAVATVGPAQILPVQ